MLTAATPAKVVVPPPNAALDDEIRRLLGAGKKVDAIKLVYERNPTYRLATSKAYVEAVQKGTDPAQAVLAMVQLPKTSDGKLVAIGFGISFLILIGIVMFAEVMSRFEERAAKEQAEAARAQALLPAPAPPENTRLEATVNFTGAQFEIANRGLVDWKNVTFDLNGGLFSSGYVHRLGELKALNEYTVGSMQFANSSGTRFSPFQMKPQQMSITATLPSGSLGVRIVQFE